MLHRSAKSTVHTHPCSCSTPRSIAVPAPPVRASRSMKGASCVSAMPSSATAPSQAQVSPDELHQRALLHLLMTGTDGEEKYTIFMNLQTSSNGASPSLELTELTAVGPLDG